MFKDFKHTPEEWLKVFDTQRKWMMEHCSHSGNKDSLFMNFIDFDTYDGGVDEMLAPRFTAVIKSILDRETFEHIKKSEQCYHDYLVVCNLPRFKDRIEWGVSIRGAWFELHKEFDFYNELPVTSGEGCHLMCDDEAKYEAYIRGLIMWMEKEEPNEQTNQNVPTGG